MSGESRAWRATSAAVSVRCSLGSGGARPMRRRSDSSLTMRQPAGTGAGSPGAAPRLRRSGAVLWARQTSVALRLPARTSRPPAAATSPARRWRVTPCSRPTTQRQKLSELIATFESAAREEWPRRIRLQARSRRPAATSDKEVVHESLACSLTRSVAETTVSASQSGSGVCDGCPRQLEGIPEAVPRLVRRGALSGDEHVIAGPLQHPQPGDRKPRQAAIHRPGDRGDGRRRGPRQGLRGRQERLRLHRGRGARCDQDREHTHDRHRELRPGRAGRQALSRGAVLHRARRQGRAGGVRGHPRRHEGEGQGRDRARRDLPPRADGAARAARQGHHGDDAALPLRGRGEEPYFEDIPELKIPKEMRDLAGHIIETKSADFEPAKFEDRYENAMIELVKSKETGRPVAAPEAPRPSNVVNLMDALRKSIAAEPPAASKKAASKTSAERAPKAAKKARPAGRKAG